ncbi:hypothetical protein [Clostridium sp.]|jgi:hypothetical protein|uniref:hypothetical protein n=1 Tax=Clostridium sp. TaxID=1506 RepID=UPI003EEED0D4
MKKIKKSKKVKFNKIAALAIIVSVSSSGAPVYALTPSNIKRLNINASNSQLYKKPLANSNIDKLSSTGAVSKNEEVIISNLFTNYRNSISKAIENNFSSRLDSFIDLGNITQHQKKEIMSLYSISNTNTVGLIGIKSLVTSETITKEQEITILNSFIHCKKSTSKNLNDILLLKIDKLISLGTINGVQGDAVINLARIPE